MSWFDVGVLVLAVLGAVDGYVRGLVGASVGLVMLVLTVLVAAGVHPATQPYLLKVAHVSRVNLPWVTHLTTFLLVGSLFLGLSMLLQPMAKKCRFDHDKWLGAVVGLLFGAALGVTCLTFLVWSTPRSYEGELRHAHSLRVLEPVAVPGANVFLPVGLAQRLRQIGVE